MCIRDSILNYINKTGSVPKMSTGGEIDETNPYIQQFEESMANVPTEHYSREQIRNAPVHEHQTTSRGGRRNLTQDQMRSANEKQWKYRQDERRAKARELLKDEQVLSGSSPIMSLFGALRKRGHRKAAAKHALINEKKAVVPSRWDIMEDRYNREQESAPLSQRIAERKKRLFG